MKAVPMLVSQYAEKNYQQYFTDAEDILTTMVHLLGDVTSKTVLEPCAGQGAFLRNLLGTPKSVDAVDIDQLHVAELKRALPSFANVQTGDFIDYFVQNGLSIGDDGYRLSLHSNYDAIICNPPYGLPFTVEYRKLIKKRFPDIYARESYGLFLYFGISLLKPGGRYVFIVPDTFFTSTNHKELRRFLVNFARPTHIVQFKSSRFETVNFGYGSLVIIAGDKVPLTPSDSVVWHDLRSDQRSIWEVVRCDHEKTPGSYLISQSPSGWVHPALMNQSATFKHVLLGEIAECRTGIYTGDNTRFCGYDPSGVSRRVNGRPISWHSEVCSRVVTEAEKQEGISDGPFFVPFIRGGHRKPFEKTAWAIDWSPKSLHYYRTDKKARLQNSRFYFRTGIAVPMVTSGRLSASLMSGAVFDQGVVGIFPHDEKLIGFLLLYLNSDHVSSVVKKTINPGANNSANYIKRIPVPILSGDDLAEAQALVQKCVNLGWDQMAEQRESFVNRFV